MERYLINYLREISDNSLERKYIDFFKIELDWFIYNYGDNVSSITLSSYRSGRKNLRPFFREQIQYLSSLLFKVKSHENNILSGVFFKDPKILHDLGFNLVSSVFQPVYIKNILGDLDQIKLLKKKNKIIYWGSFNDLFDVSLFREFEDLKEKVLQSYLEYDLKALFLKTDQTFESKYLLDIFKSLNRPSFIFSHGLPGIYSKEVDNRSDYLLVWGEQIKQNYIDVGFDPQKIFVVGSSSIVFHSKNIKLKNSLNDILVIPCSSSLWHQHEWGLPKLNDRSMSILYLYQVQHTLEQLGVKHARFRPHPSINSKWMYNFLDKNFYEIDRDNLNDSLNRTTLVIGATSTVFLQALVSGVNYIVFEPNENGIPLLRSPLVPPFDDSDPLVKVASDEKELLYLIKSKYQTNPGILDKYLRPLNLDILRKII